LFVEFFANSALYCPARWNATLDSWAHVAHTANRTNKPRRALALRNKCLEWWTSTQQPMSSERSEYFMNAKKLNSLKQFLTATRPTSQLKRQKSKSCYCFNSTSS